MSQPSKVKPQPLANLTEEERARLLGHCGFDELPKMTMDAWESASDVARAAELAAWEV